MKVTLIENSKDSLLEATLRRQQELEKEFNLPIPLPLRRRGPPSGSFPFKALGSILGPAAERMHEVIQAPDAICAQSILAASALAAQGHVDIHLDGRISPLSLFFLSVAESGDRKSAVDSIALRPAFKHQKALVSRFQLEKGNYQHQMELYTQRKKEASGQSKIIPDLTEPTKPLEPICIVEEPTYESLVNLLKIGQPSIGVFSDEGGRMLFGHAMEEKNQIKTVCGLSSLWDGKPITRSRVGEGHSILYGKRVSLHLMIQDVILDQLMKNEVLKKQGFLARCLIAFPFSLAGSRFYQSVDLSKDKIILRYWEALERLFECSLSIEKSLNALTPRPIVLDHASKELWVTWHDEIDRKLGEGKSLAPIKGFACKSPELLLRIAGVLSIVANPDAEQITLQEMEQAVELMDYYLYEALRLEGSFSSDPDLTLAEKTLAWLTKRVEEKGENKILLSEIYQYGPSLIRNAKKARHILNVLQAHHYGYIESIIGPNGKKCREAWVFSSCYTC